VQGKPALRWLLVSFLLLSLPAGLAARLALAADTPESQLAKEVLAASGVQGGLVVHLGCGDGKLTAALGAAGAYLVQGLSGRGRLRSRALDLPLERTNSRACWGLRALDRSL